MSRIARITTVILLAASIGLHWAVLQSVAWMGMLVTYSAESDFSTAVVKTFDGQHPCKLCLTVSAGKKAEREQKGAKQFHKIEFALFDVAPQPVRPGSVALHIPAMIVPPHTSLEPPSPPPRLA